MLCHCGNSLIIEGPFRDLSCGLEMMVARCVDPHHNMYQERRIPSLPPERKFTPKHYHRLAVGNGGWAEREITCAVCGRVEIRFCYPRANTCEHGPCREIQKKRTMEKHNRDRRKAA